MPAALSTHPPLTDRDDSDEGSACNTRLSGITYNLTSPASLSSSGSDPGQWLTPPAASPFTHSSRTSNWSFEDEPSWCSACLAGVGRWVIGKLAEDISRSEAWLLATITGVNFLSFCAGSIIAPILPQHLAKKMEQFGKEGKGTMPLSDFYHYLVRTSIPLLAEGCYTALISTSHSVSTVLPCSNKRPIERSIFTI